ncbi:conserved hypothetical protein [Theileria orientalis strain Shintoku]|uniref:Vacuolar protein sorting-associated protein 51 homolog n=1 Tax=Theileria orientalis strain Shintoku TaxID=869250 RepID=J4C8N4_THEOR|nr:conserved hypothetical protein [Theileria orientalis strain Shintoku]PVC54392.1 hypothetical protein MACL_00003101 [Theileria orientalis]BAM41093.1 conserved hypothetical protein [Theileria orientalis strain Shintoku]|eukprot:XP_009691394.1 conserved hypothetical protein [Theileria orientalis strain Shintoku]
MDRKFSSNKDDVHISQESKDKSVSELLSSYYSISDTKQQNTDSSSDFTSSKAVNPTSVIDKDFLSHTFDVDYHLDNILKNNSISDTISFLRKLERETRQLTAGKQLLIYDNYECLFSALDTIQGINKDLDGVETNLRNLNASQIKAASKDITSKYGIRDKFLQISQMSKAANVFKFLASLCNTIGSFSSSNTLFCSNEDESSNVLKFSRKEVLYFCSRVYYVFKYFDANYTFLFSSYYGILTDLISRNTRSLLSEDEPLDPEDSVELCKSLRELSFDERQLLELYFYNLSSLLESKMKNLFMNYTNDDFSFSTLCKEVFASLLWVVYESVSNEKFVAFLSSLKGSKKRHKFCFYCNDEFEVDFKKDQSDLFNSFNLESTKECRCSGESLASQFVLYYSQASFYIIAYLISSYKHTLVTKEAYEGLTGLFGRLYTLDVRNGNQALFAEQTHNWLMYVCVLYLQHLFFKLYDSVIYKSVSLLNGTFNSDLNAYILSSFEKLVQELQCFKDLVREVSSSLKNNFEQVFNALLAIYTCGIKYIYHLIFVNINSISYRTGEVDYLDSLSNMVSLRSCTEKTREHMAEDFVKQTAQRLAGEDKGSQVDDGRTMFSLLEFMDRNVKSQLKKFKFDGSHHRTYTKNLLSFLIKFESVFGGVGGVLEKNCSEAYKMFKQGSRCAHLRAPESGHHEELKSKMRRHVLSNTNHAKFQTIFDEFMGNEQVPVLNVILLAHEYAILSRRHFPMKLSEEGVDHTAVLDGKKVVTSTKGTGASEETVYKTHFETFNVSIEELANELVAQIMLAYIDKSLKIVRYVLDNLESGVDVIDESVKDFTLLLSDVLQDVNLLNMAQVSAEVASENKNLDKMLNSALNSSDTSPLVNVYNYRFNTSRDMCLKLFTMHIVQALSQYKASYNVDESHLTRFYDGLKQQILIIFKKNLDLFIMQSVWERVMTIQ